MMKQMKRKILKDQLSINRITKYNIYILNHKIFNNYIN